MYNQKVKLYFMFLDFNFDSKKSHQFKRYEYSDYLLTITDTHVDRFVIDFSFLLIIIIPRQNVSFLTKINNK